MSSLLVCYGIIYKITNTTNNKVYIGQTTKTIRSRFSGHKYNAFTRSRQLPLYNAMRKYGADSFTCEEIAKAYGAEELDYLEGLYIKQYKSTDRQFGYNVLDTATTNPMHSDIGKTKIKALWQDPVYCKMQSQSRTGIIRDDSWREHHSSSAKEMWKSPGHKKKISDKAKENCAKDPRVKLNLSKGTAVSVANKLVKARDRLALIKEVAKTCNTITEIAKKTNKTLTSVFSFLNRHGEIECVREIMRSNNEPIRRSDVRESEGD